MELALEADELAAVGSEPDCTERRKYMRIAVARAVVASSARGVDVSRVRINVILHLSLGTGGLKAHPRPYHRPRASRTSVERHERQILRHGARANLVSPASSFVAALLQALPRHAALEASGRASA